MAQLIDKGKNKLGERMWLIIVFLGCDEKGERKYHREAFTGTQSAAKAKATSLQNDHNEGKLTIGSESLLISSLLDNVERDYRINGFNPGGLARASLYAP